MPQIIFHDMSTLIQVIPWWQQVITSGNPDPDLCHSVCYCEATVHQYFILLHFLKMPSQYHCRIMCTIFYWSICENMRKVNTWNTLLILVCYKSDVWLNLCARCRECDAIRLCITWWITSVSPVVFCCRVSNMPQDNDVSPELFLGNDFFDHEGRNDMLKIKR